MAKWDGESCKSSLLALAPLITVSLMQSLILRGFFDDECGYCKIVDQEKDQYDMECLCKSVSQFKDPTSTINLSQYHLLC